MSLHCDIVRDLIALYHDGLASPATKKAVAAHLQHCCKCRMEYKQYRNLCTDITQLHTAPSEQYTAGDFPLLAARIRKKRIWTMAGMMTYVCLSCFVWILIFWKVWYQKK